MCLSLTQSTNKQLKSHYRNKTCCCYRESNSDRPVRSESFPTCWVTVEEGRVVDERWRDSHWAVAMLWCHMLVQKVKCVTLQRPHYVCVWKWQQALASTLQSEGENGWSHKNCSTCEMSGHETDSMTQGLPRECQEMYRFYRNFLAVVKKKNTVRYSKPAELSLYLHNPFLNNSF
jgi:hypothetical protein